MSSAFVSIVMLILQGIEKSEDGLASSGIMMILNFMNIVLIHQQLRWEGDYIHTYIHTYIYTYIHVCLCDTVGVMLKL
jgi:hypothetical protein